MFKFQEKILLNEIKRGDQAALGKLYNEYVDKIYRFIYFNVSSIDNAQDLTSQLFIRLLNYLANNQKAEIDNLQAFLFAMARNLLTDFYRSNSNRLEMPIDEFIEENISDRHNFEDMLNDKLEIEALDEKLKILPDDYREIIVLRFVNEFSFKEIANIINSSEGNARIKAFRGLKMLKNSLKTEK